LTLVHDRNPYEYNRVLNDKDNFASSITVLLLDGKSENQLSFIQLISRLVRVMVLSQGQMVPKDQDQIPKLAYLQDSVISMSISCLTAICQFIKSEQQSSKPKKDKPVLENQAQPQVDVQMEGAPQINDPAQGIQMI
jgi:hypothetical protein